MDDSDPNSGSARAPETHFAPAARSSVEEIARQVALIVDHPVVRTVLEAFCGQVLILNQRRQILAASPEFREALFAYDIGDYVGLRPGEALGCEHAQEGPGGCGTSLACRHCGAVLAILTAQCCLGPTYEECWISMRRKHGLESVEFRAKATPIKLGDTEVIVLALHDISDQKRRRVLEHSFLHDARNLVSGVMAWSDVLLQERGDEAADSLTHLARQLRDLLSEHAMLAQAEKGELVATMMPIDLQALAHLLTERFSSHPSGEGKTLLVVFPERAPPLISDQDIVSRILSNMVTNAFEASRPGAEVEVCYACQLGRSNFTVHNPGAIPQDVSARIFQRSFSSKTEPGHGLGTYSMRLLAERYLSGQVTFTSSQEAGTTFCLSLPGG
jgi:hypothetical protein